MSRWMRHSLLRIIKTSRVVKFVSRRTITVLTPYFVGRGSSDKNSMPDLCSRVNQVFEVGVSQVLDASRLGETMIGNGRKMSFVR